MKDDAPVMRPEDPVPDGIQEILEGLAHHPQAAERDWLRARLDVALLSYTAEHERWMARRQEKVQSAAEAVATKNADSVRTATWVLAASTVVLAFATIGLIWATLAA